MKFQHNFIFAAVAGLAAFDAIKHAFTATSIGQLDPYELSIIVLFISLSVYALWKE